MHYDCSQVFFKNIVKAFIIGLVNNTELNKPSIYKSLNGCELHSLLIIINIMASIIKFNKINIL